jgi:soluble lytic murein transglycosylase-like protein
MKFIGFKQFETSGRRYPIDPAAVVARWYGRRSVLRWTLRRTHAVCTLMLLSVVLHVGTVQADAVWQFVDRDGVVHMGNAAPPQTRGLVWIDQPPMARTGQAPERGVGALKLPGYKDAKPHLEAAALSAAIDPALVIAVAAAESAFNTEAVSRKGALGLMQVMPATAERYGVAAHSTAEGRKAVMEPQVNAQIGSRYLADLLRLFDGDKELALAAYNAGEGAVMKYGKRIPPYPETQQYVERVMRLYRTLSR